LLWFWLRGTGLRNVVYLRDFLWYLKQRKQTRQDIVAKTTDAPNIPATTTGLLKNGTLELPSLEGMKLILTSEERGIGIVIGASEGMTDGFLVGSIEGIVDGLVDGTKLGSFEGLALGIKLGNPEGAFDGVALGRMVGETVGFLDGLALG
jgi:hypothetical protein